jgi:alanyl-tRNA synthetase
VEEILVGDAPADRMEPGTEGALVLRETPFYAEQGGQVGDAGEVRGPGGALFRVRDTRKVEGFHLHLGALEGGPLSRGDRVRAAVDRERRDAVRRNHTATHLLHRVLRDLLGEEARQAGSLVAPDYLRFDFSFPRGLTPEERERIEAEVNRRVYENHPVATRVLDLEAARATGAVSMFGEKYGTRVRVLEAGDSREFCGGTHCRSTGDVGPFRVLSERSIGSGVRRIEAVTGARAVRETLGDRRRLLALEAEVERLKKEAGRKETGKKRAGASVVGLWNWDHMVEHRLVKRQGQLEYVIRRETGWPEDSLLSQADRVKNAGTGPKAGLILSEGEGTVSLVAAGNPDAVRIGYDAASAVLTAAKALGGGGGGRPDLARGKGKDPARIPEAVAAFEAYLGGL